MKLFNKARSMGLVALLIGAGTLLAQPAKIYDVSVPSQPTTRS